MVLPAHNSVLAPNTNSSQVYRVDTAGHDAGMEMQFATSCKKKLKVLNQLGKTHVFSPSHHARFKGMRFTTCPSYSLTHRQQVHHIWFLLNVQGFQCTGSGRDLWFCITYLQSAWFCTTEIQRDPATSCNGSRNKHQAGRGLWKEGRTKEYCKIPDVLTSENPHIAATNARMV